MTSSLSSPEGTALARLRSASHYPFARKVIRIACTIYIFSAVVGLLASMSWEADFVSGGDGFAVMLIRVAGRVLSMAGALVVRELLWMAVDLLDGAIDRRAATSAPR